MSEITGTLENWYISGTVVIGDVYGDTKLRFANGELIRTSKVLSPGLDDLKEGTVVITRNSTYKLGKPHK